MLRAPNKTHAAWYGRLGAPRHSAPNGTCKSVAERVGFEPTVRFRTHAFHGRYVILNKPTPVTEVGLS